MNRLIFTLLSFVVLAFVYSDVKALSNNCSNAIPLIDAQPVVLEMCNSTLAEVQPEGIDFDIRDRWLSFNTGVHNEVLLSLDNLAGVGMTVSAEFHIVGCTDPCLISFNPDATIDNGTCI